MGRDELVAWLRLVHTPGVGSDFTVRLPLELPVTARTLRAL